MNRRVIATDNAPAAVGPYSQAVCAGPLVFTCGQVPVDPQTGQLVEGDAGVQTRRVLDNLGAVLSAAGLTWADVVKTTLFLTDLDQYPVVNQVYAEYFPKNPPARSTVEVSRLRMNATIEIEMIAYSGPM
jgi:2-iminobutanoate/2-iminopropanoate deaminase